MFRYLVLNTISGTWYFISGNISFPLEINTTGCVVIKLREAEGGWDTIKGSVKA